MSRRMRSRRRWYGGIVGAAVLTLGSGSTWAALPSDGRYDVAVLSIPTPDSAFWQVSSLNAAMLNAPGIAPWTLGYVPTSQLTGAGALSAYDVLVVSGIDRSWLNQGASSTLLNFVQNGGVLIVSPVQPTSTGTEPMLHAFGTQYDLQYATTGSPGTGCVGPGTSWPSKNLSLYDTSNSVVQSPNLVNTVFTDCDFVRPVNLGSAYRVAVSTTNYSRFQPGSFTQVELATASYGSGKIIITSAAFNLNTPQHKRLAENMIWQADVLAPDTTPPAISFVAPPPATSNPVLDIAATATDAGGLFQVTLSLNGATVPSTLDTAGNLRGTINLVEGPNDIVIQAVDRSGNVSVATANVVLDTAAPFVALDPLPSFTASPTFTTTGMVYDSGTGLASASFYLNGTLGSIVSAASDGSASATLALGEGPNVVELRAIDLVGNTAAVQGVVTLDTIPPDVRLLNIPAITAHGDLAVLGSVGDTNGVASARLLVDGVDVSSLLLDPSGDVTASVNLTEGPHSLVLQATDVAGNQGAQSVDVLVDSTAPTVTVLSPAAGQVLGTSSFDLTVRVDDVTATMLMIGDQAFDVPAGGGTVTATLTLPAEGLNDIAIGAVDEAGNTASTDLSLTLDLTAPLVTVDVLDGAAFGPLLGDLLPVSIVVDDLTATTAVIGGTTYDLAEGGGVVYAALPLSEGSNVIDVVVTDAAGINTTVTRSVSYDTLPPSGALSLPPYVRGVIDLSATATDTGTGVAALSFAVDGGASIPATQTTSGAWIASFDAAGLSDGAHTVSASITDGVGNSSSISTSVTVDQTAPTVGIASPTAGIYVGGSLTIAANAADATSGLSHLDISVGGMAVATCTTSPCSVSFDTMTLPDGPFRITATALDQAGNAGNPVQIDVIADNSAPSRFLTSPTAGSIVGSSINVAVSVSDSSFATVECFVGSVSLGVSTSPTFSAAASSLGLQDGPVTVRCVATDAAGNVGTDSATVTVKNASVVLNPSTLNLKSKGGATSITLAFEAPNASLYVPSASMGWALLVPGGSAVSATPHSGADSVADSDKDGIPDLTLKFDRTALIASIQAGIASGAIKTSQPVSVSLAAGGRIIGTDSIVIK